MYGSRVIMIVAGDDDDDSTCINDGNIHWYRVKLAILIVDTMITVSVEQSIQQQPPPPPPPPSPSLPSPSLFTYREHVDIPVVTATSIASNDVRCYIPCNTVE